MENVVISGMGIISALGCGVEETLRALREERSGIGPLKYLQTDHRDIPCAEVPFSDEELRERLGLSPEDVVTRTALFGMMALKEAWEAAALRHTPDYRLAFINGTTVGGMEKSEQYYLDFLENDSRNAYIATHECGACTEKIADFMGGFGYVTTLSTACSSAANAIILGENLIRAGLTDIAVAGGSECITKFHLNGFRTLMILDAVPCRPFDITRAGLNLGEGAAYVVLEKESSARKRGVQPLCRLSGYGNACDAFHQTASSEEGIGAMLAMQEALKTSGLQPSDIDYINAHGTGTRNNDASEGRAIMQVFGEHIPRVSSTKAMTGHTTSASGSVETVISVLAIRHGFIPANLRFREAISELSFTLVAHTIENVKVRNVLSNSFGFGGNNSSLVFSAVDVGDYKRVCSIKRKNDMGVYIGGAAAVSIQEPLSEKGIFRPMTYTTPQVRCMEPDFRKFLEPMVARRMSKIVKRAIVVSSVALEEAGIPMPDAIVSGTGLGCVEDTEKFLDAMVRNGEHCLQPTFFIQSTHNTISSQIAIRLGCHGYNNTHVHRGISFESALQETMLLFGKGSIHSALVGGYDELTPTYFRLLGRIGYWRKEVTDSLHIVQEPASGTFAGEGSIAFALSENSQGAWARVEGVSISYACPDFTCETELFLQRFGLNWEDVDIVMTGKNGDRGNDRVYRNLSLPDGQITAVYKPLCGEFFTAPAFGMYVAAVCLRRGILPASLAEDGKEIRGIRRILLLNHWQEKDYSLILLSSCGD